MPTLPDIQQVDETDSQFERVLAWLIKERTEYQKVKWNYGEWDDKNTQEFADKEHPFDTMQWVVQIENYTHRAFVLGLDTPGGRQALAKAAATVVAMVESTIRVFGDLPTPGVPSGELNEWKP